MLLSGAVASNVVEVGIGKNAGQDLMAVFAGQCVGVKTGVSAGGSVNLFGWKNISSIPGESHAFTIAQLGRGSSGQFFISVWNIA